VTLAEQVRQQIADDILSGRLKPGQQLEENALAAQFNVSRTPVRDALRQLGSTGLVEVRPHRGVRVADIDVSLLEELFEAQTEVEAVCAQLTALRSNATDRRQLQLLQAELE
jgi:DNA-binding GntR family transcriptional regulator